MNFGVFYSSSATISLLGYKNSWLYSLIYHSKTKHHVLNAHYIQYLVVDGTISLTYCPTDQLAVDIFFKSMIDAKFLHLNSLLGIREVFINGEH
jgi:hypothetical protein